MPKNVWNCFWLYLGSYSYLIKERPWLYANLLVQRIFRIFRNVTYFETILTNVGPSITQNDIDCAVPTPMNFDIDSLSWRMTWVPGSWRRRSWSKHGSLKPPSRTHIYTLHIGSRRAARYYLQKTNQRSEIIWLKQSCLQQVCVASTRISPACFGSGNALRWWLWWIHWLVLEDVVEYQATYVHKSNIQQDGFDVFFGLWSPVGDISFPVASIFNPEPLAVE